MFNTIARVHENWIFNIEAMTQSQHQPSYNIEKILTYDSEIASKIAFHTVHALNTTVT